MEQEDTHLREVQKLFLQHSNRLRGFILGLLPNRPLAEDVLQEVFLIGTAKAAEFQSGTDFLAWVPSTPYSAILAGRKQPPHSETKTQHSPNG